MFDYSSRIARAMRRLTRYLDIHSHMLLKTSNITVPQVMCLDELRQKGAMTVAVLAAAIHLSPSTTVGIIDRLEKKKLVKRKRNDKDHRSVYVEITDLGNDFLVASPHLLHNRLYESLKEIPAQEQIVIANALERMVQVLMK